MSDWLPPRQRTEVTIRTGDQEVRRWAYMGLKSKSRRRRLRARVQLIRLAVHDWAATASLVISLLALYVSIKNGGK